VLSLVFEEGLNAPPDAGREVCVWRDDLGDTFARGFADRHRRWIEWRDWGLFAFSQGSTMVHAWPAAGMTRAAVADVFARVLQPIILQGLGWQALHASAVLSADGVLAFCGVGRSGKSTLAYALSRAGFEQIADDAVVIEPAGDGVLTHLLPFVPGLREPSRQHFGEWVSAEGTRDCSSLPEQAWLRAVFVLRQDETLSGPELPQRIQPVQAFSALVTHARCFDEYDAVHLRRLVADYLQVAERVPVFSLNYPPRFAQFAELTEVITATARTVGIVPLKRLRPTLVP
jgi:hypothetical protein